MVKPNETVNWYYTETNKIIPRTTTQEMLEMGCKKIKKIKTVSRKQLNFQSYPLNDLRLELMTFERPKIVSLTTSYKRDYASPNAKICPAKFLMETTPDYLFNRKTINDFCLERLASSEFMFMDDHFVNLTQARRKINMLRQLRNRHYPLV